MKLETAGIHRIGIFRALQLGDILCAIPALRNLRLNFPKAHISFIGLKGNKVLIDRYDNYFDNFIVFPGYPGLPEQAFDGRLFDEFCSEVNSRKFDLILQMQGDGTIVNDMLRIFVSKKLAGFSTDQTELEDNPLMMPYPNFGHESQRHLKLMHFLNVPISNTEMEFPVFNQDEEEFAEERFPLAQKFMCIHPGSRAHWRQWPVEYFAKIADICFKNGYQVVLTGNGHEVNLANVVSEKMQYTALNLAGRTTLGTLAVLLKKSSGLIANCTGISHISAALKIQSVIISMDGEPERWGGIDTKLHSTIDWTKNPDFRLVKEAVLNLLASRLNCATLP